MANRLSDEDLDQLGEDAERCTEVGTNELVVLARDVSSICAELRQLRGKLARIADTLRPIRSTHESAGPHIVKMLLDETFVEGIGIPTMHPDSWLDCPECKSLSKAGAEPPRCAVWMSMKERANG